MQFRVSLSLFVFFLGLYLSGCGGGYRLTGKVQDAAFVPLNGARVVVKYMQRTDSMATRTDETGMFVFEGIKEPRVVVRASAPKYVPQEKVVRFRKKEQSETFILEYKSASITGKVVDSRTQEPIANARVMSVDGAFQTMTDIDGKFTISGPGLTPGITYVLEIWKVNYKPEQRTVQVAEAEDRDIGVIPLIRMAGASAVKIEVGAEHGLASEEDVEVSTVIGRGFYNRKIDEFLLEKENFSYLEFKQLFGKDQSDEAIRLNLQSLIEQKRVEQIDRNRYRSLDYVRKYQK
ncbi:MAG: carboxypeptidase regulatory-like domain-containing protein [Calditrichaeota bacterium]|nr:carboxypeptidase regulatory-like domain-containing protein [Calditrichota bacterium]